MSKSPDTHVTPNRTPTTGKVLHCTVDDFDTTAQQPQVDPGPCLVIVRGLPGSGKSTFAKGLVENQQYRHFEADQYFTAEDGTYNWNRDDAQYAHHLCQFKTMHALCAGKNVVVANTFVLNSSVGPYLVMAEITGARIIIVEATGNYGSIHNVPHEAIERMRSQWEPIPCHIVG